MTKELTSRFSDVIDEHSALILFRKVSQGKNEIIQAFHERVLDLAEQAFVGANISQPAYQTQIVMCFTDGLRDNRIARHVIRSRSQTLEGALKAATSELNLLKQLDARGKNEYIPPNTPHRMEEPMEIDVTSLIKSRPRFQGNCYKCGIKGLIVRLCRQKFHHVQSQPHSNVTNRRGNFSSAHKVRKVQNNYLNYPSTR